MTTEHHQSLQVLVTFIKVDVSLCHDTDCGSSLYGRELPQNPSEEAEITSEPGWVFTLGQLK